MGLSAWKQYGHSRWALRVNPSSGNLHPTEAYVVHDRRTFHYAPREHALEERCVFDQEAWRRLMGTPDAAFLVALTSIHWREAWKYGERAFRYCQHDVGHALGALRLAGAMLGWQVTLLPEWSDRDLGRLLGVDRDADFSQAEREEPDCMAIVGAPADAARVAPDPSALLSATADGSWRGVANRLSAGHVEWPAIDEVAEATRYPGQRRVRRCDGARCESAGAKCDGARCDGAGAQADAAPPPAAFRRTFAPSHPRTSRRPRTSDGAPSSA